MQFKDMAKQWRRSLDQPDTSIAYGGHVCKRIGMKWAIVIHGCFLPRFGSFGQAVSEKNNLFNWQTRNQNWLWRPFLWTDQNVKNNLHKTIYYIWAGWLKRDRKATFRLIKCVCTSEFWQLPSAHLLIKSWRVSTFPSTTASIILWRKLRNKI